MMSNTPGFGTQLIGQTEKALNALLDRQLAGTGVTEPQWVILTVAVMSGGTIDRASLRDRIAGALKTSDGHAQALIEELAVAGLLDVPDDDGSAVTVTESGAQLHSRIRGNVAEITRRLWGDLDDEELAGAARVLAVVLERANTELAAA